MGATVELEARDTRCHKERQELSVAATAPVPYVLRNLLGTLRFNDIASATPRRTNFDVFFSRSSIITVP
jgi:hypothetical protein